MEIIKTKKINVSELKGKLNDALAKSMKDRANMSISKDDIKEVIDVLEYLEDMNEKEQEESQKKEKKCCRVFSATSLPCMICERYDKCKHVYGELNKILEESRINQNRSIIEGCNGMEE